MGGRPRLTVPIGLFVLFALSVWPPATRGARAAEPEFPKLTGRVVDLADLLQAQDMAALTADLAALEKKSTDQLVVVTLKSLQGYPIEEFGYRLGRHWGIGQKDKNNGVLLIVAPNERKVRIEVGRGLEPVLTDALTKLIITNGVLPKFRQKDFAGGIKTGVRDIIAVLTGDAEAVRLRSQSRPEDDDDIVSLIIFLIWMAIVIAVMWNVVRSKRHGATGGRGGPIFLPGGSGGSSGGGWSGGFGGGGGGFGGGGASGGW